MDNYAARQDKYERFKRECMERAKPDIIIWGPGPSFERLYEKKKCVKAAIKREVPKGDVAFPEDPKMVKLIRKVFGDVDVDVMEQIEALHADIIIVLDLSPAVGEEVARYSTNPRIASKLFVVTSYANKSGYQKAVRNKPVVRDLKGHSMDSCDEPIEVCVNHVRSWCILDGLREASRP